MPYGGGDRRVAERMVYFTKTKPAVISVSEGFVKERLFRVYRGVLEMVQDGEVYSLSGRLVFRGKGRVVLPRGVYFVKFKDRVFKVIVR